MHAPHSRKCLHFYNHNFPFANRKLENLSFRTCTYAHTVCNAINLLQKFFKLTLAQYTAVFLHCHLQWICARASAFNFVALTTVWEFATMFNCNFVIANTSTAMRFTFASDSFLFVVVSWIIRDTCKFPSNNLAKTSASHFPNFTDLAHAALYVPNRSRSRLITQIIIAKDTMQICIQLHSHFHFNLFKCKENECNQICIV